MEKNEDKNYDKKHIDEILALNDINYFLRGLIEYAILEKEDKVKVCLEVYNNFLEVNTNEDTLENYLENNNDFINKTLRKMAESNDGYLDAQFGMNNYCAISSLLHNYENFKSYCSLDYKARAVAVLSVYNSYCRSLFGQDMLKANMIEDYINNNKEKINNILEYIRKR